METQEQKQDLETFYSDIVDRATSELKGDELADIVIEIEQSVRDKMTPKGREFVQILHDYFIDRLNRIN